MLIKTYSLRPNCVSCWTIYTLFYVLYRKYFQCIAPFKHRGNYIDHNFQLILLNIPQFRLSYRIYVILSETEGLWRKVNKYDFGTNIWNSDILLVEPQRTSCIRTENLPSALLDLYLYRHLIRLTPLCSYTSLITVMRLVTNVSVNDGPHIRRWSHSIIK